MVFSSPQSDPNAELETQTSNLGKGGILLSSLALGQEEQRLVAVGQVRLRLGVLLCDHHKGLGEGPERGSRSDQQELSYGPHLGCRWESSLQCA